MIEEQIISFETAKLAKEKGFHWVGWIIDQGKPVIVPGAAKGSMCYNAEAQIITPKMFNRVNPHYPAPTQSLIQKWLREVHKIDVNPENCIEYPLDKKLRRVGYGGNVYLRDKDKNTKSFFAETYEEALEKGIFEALKLIKNDSETDS